jgi:Spy/CpxP family protein refolding chaperone
MKTFLKTLGTAAVALAATAALALAQGADPQAATPPGGPGWGHFGHHMGRGMGPGMGADMMGRGISEHFDRLADALNFTADQRASLERLKSELTSTAQPLLDARRNAMTQLRDAVDNGSTDACALGQLVLQAHGNGDALKAAHDRFEAGLIALLTPEQKSQYDAIKALRPQFHRGGPPSGDEPSAE